MMRGVVALLSVLLPGAELYADETVETYKRQIRECIVNYSDTEEIAGRYLKNSGEPMPESRYPSLRYHECFTRYGADARHFLVYKYDPESSIKVTEAIFQVSEEDCPYHYHVSMTNMRWTFMQLYAAYEDIMAPEKQNYIKEYFFKVYQEERTRGTPPLSKRELEMMFEKDMTEAKMRFYYSNMGYMATQTGRFGDAARYMRLQVESYKHGIQLGIREGNPNKPTHEQSMAKVIKLLKEELPAKAKNAGARLWPWEAAGGWDFWLSDLFEDMKNNWQKSLLLAVCITAGIAWLVIRYKRSRVESP